MKMKFLLIFIVLLAGSALGQTPPATAAAVQPAKQMYLVVYKPGPKWLAGKPLAEQPLKEHFRYMVSLYRSGTLRLAGPFSNDAGGAVFFEASSREDAVKTVENDPAVISQLFVFELNRWDLVSWDQYVKK